MITHYSLISRNDTALFNSLTCSFDALNDDLKLIARADLRIDARLHFDDAMATWKALSIHDRINNSNMFRGLVSSAKQIGRLNNDSYCDQSIRANLCVFAKATGSYVVFSDFHKPIA